MNNLVGERKIILENEIKLKTVEQILKKLFKFQELSLEPIIFEINESYGGPVILSIILYQILRHSVADITTIVRKKAESGALIAFQGGKVRKICKNATLKFHWTETELKKDFVMNFSSLDSTMSYVEKCNEQLYGVIIESSGLVWTKVIEFFQQKKVVSAREAVRLN